MTTSKTSRTIGERVDLGEPLSSSNKTHEVFLCPYCLSLTGKADIKGHMWVARASGFGFCFRCESVIVPHIAETLNFDHLFSKIGLGKPAEAPSPPLNLSGWSAPLCPVGQAVSYVESRRIAYEVAKAYDVREVCAPGMPEGVVFVNRVERLHGMEVTDYLQVRNINRRLRHSGVRASVKPLAWADKVRGRQVALVEGFFSGLSVYQATLDLDEPVYPLVLSGKSLRDNQIVTLRKLLSKRAVSQIYVILDGGFTREALRACKAVYGVAYNAKVWLTCLREGLDPNDHKASELRAAIADSLVYAPGADKFFEAAVRARENRSLSLAS